MKAQTELIRKRLDRKIAVITDGNSGIGLATGGVWPEGRSSWTISISALFLLIQ
jgi:hypothetical protein